MEKRRNDYFLDKRCADCGSKENLELDHVYRQTKITHRIWSWSKQRQEEELAKCVARCHTCHVKKTLDKDLPRAKHGTRSKYNAGCRCAECREALRVDVSKWREQKKTERMCSTNLVS
jgi:hypothetical protein